MLCGHWFVIFHMGNVSLEASVKVFSMGNWHNAPETKELQVCIEKYEFLLFINVLQKK